jgi:hypothetical protein
MAYHNMGAGCGDGEGEVEILSRGVDSQLGARVQPLQPIVAVSYPAAVQICMYFVRNPFSSPKSRKDPHHI